MLIASLILAASASADCRVAKIEKETTNPYEQVTLRCKGGATLMNFTCTSDSNDDVTGDPEILDTRSGLCRFWTQHQDLTQPFDQEYDDDGNELPLEYPEAMPPTTLYARGLCCKD